ncbi:MAG: hypothetical protein IKZ96_00350 [Bacilli bacterium]|nr:hypothetical protein [Bacilli bacterium]
MKKIINIILYVVCIVFLVITFIKNPYINDLYSKKEITSVKSFNKYYNSQRFICIDLKDSKMTRFKEENTNSIVYVSTYGESNFISILTKGTSLSDKVCGIIKDEDEMSKELKTSIEEENEIKLQEKYFTNYNIKKEKTAIYLLLALLGVLAFLFVCAIISNIISLIRKEF